MGICGQKNKGQEDNRRKQSVKEKNGDDSIAIERFLLTCVIKT